MVAMRISLQPFYEIMKGSKIVYQVKVINHRFTDTNLSGKKCPRGVIITTGQIEVNNDLLTIEFEDIVIRQDGEMVSGEYNAESKIFTPQEILNKRKKEKEPIEPIVVFRIAITIITAIGISALIVFMCLGKMLAYYIFLGLIVLSVLIIGIVLLISGIRKKKKIVSENTIEVEGTITSFLETLQYENGDSMLSSREITRNEDIQSEWYGVTVQRNSFGTRERRKIRYYTPYYTYIYEGVTYNRPSIQKWRYEALKKEKLYIGKQIKICINPKDNTIYVPIEKTGGLNIGIGVLFIIVGLILAGASAFLLV